MASGPEPETGSSSAARPARSWIRRRWWVIYLLLLAASHLVSWVRSDATRQEPDAPEGSVRRSLDATIPGIPRPVRVSYLVWEPSSSAAAPETPAPVVFIHGCPGGADDFARLAPLLAKKGRRVIALDLLGFGESEHYPGDYSARANAHAVLDVLNHEQISRFHVVGWSLGGACALNVAALLNPASDEHLASVTLMAATADQRTEGSGSRAVERLTYAAFFAGTVIAPEAVPHFGLFPPVWFRNSSVRAFWDTDLRPLEGVLESLRVPTLVLHGRHDILIPDWAAQVNASHIRDARVVMMDANHFIPFLQADEAASILGWFFARHDTPGVPPKPELVDLAPHPRAATDAERWLDTLGRSVRGLRGLMLLPLAVLLMLYAPRATVTLGVVLVARQELDVTVACLWFASGLGARALFRFAAGRAAADRAAHLVAPPRAARLLGIAPHPVAPADWHTRLDRHPFRTGLVRQLLRDDRDRTPVGVGACGQRAGRIALYLVGAMTGITILSILWAVLGRMAALFQVATTLREIGWLASVAGIYAVWKLVEALPAFLTWLGRRRVLASLRRARHHEFWSAWVFYPPMAVYALWLGLRHRSLGVAICANPGIPAGGGIVGESKAELMGALGSAGGRALPTLLVPSHRGATALSPEARVAELERLPSTHGPAFAFPVILKPDSAQRGFAFKIVRSADDALTYFRGMTRDAVVQPFDPGPNEAGILWTRSPSPRTDGRAGSIFSVTAKRFPVVTGDGVRTLEELVYSHKRYRLQARTFLARFAGRTAWIPARRETVRLAAAGNHCQGTLFYDGSHLVTPELERVVDEIASGFRGPVDRTRPMSSSGAAPTGGEMDFVRFDVRFATDDDLRAGRFVIVEVNGTFGESTNMYDPDRSLFWAYSVLFRQWRTLYELGSMRRAQGARPMGMPEFFTLLGKYYKGRPGSAVAD